MSNPIQKELSLLQTRLEAWRRHYGGRGRPIPEDLWSAAALVAQNAGVETTARTLRLNRTRLARRLGTAEICELMMFNRRSHSSSLRWKPAKVPLMTWWLSSQMPRAISFESPM